MYVFHASTRSAQAGFVMCFLCSVARSATVAECVQRFLQQSGRTVFGDLHLTEFPDDFLTQHVESISICDTEPILCSAGSRPAIALAEAQLDVHVFQLHEDDGPAAETIDEQEEEIAAASHWLLPSGEPL